MAVWASGVWAADVWADNVWFGMGGGGAVAAVVKTGTGGIEPPRKRRTLHKIVKPTGIVDRKIEKRVQESHEIAREVTQSMREQFIEEPAVREEITVPPISEMSLAEIDAEIGMYLRELMGKRQKTEDEEIMILIMMVM